MAIIQKRDNKNMAQFIFDNCTKATNRDLEELFFKVYAKVLTEATGSHFSADYYHVTSYHFTNFKVNTNLNIIEVADQFIKYVENKGVDYKDFILYSSLKTVFTSGYFKRNGTKDTFRYTNQYNTDLIDFLIYLVGQKTFDDYSQASNFQQQNNISHQAVIKNAVIGNLTFSTFQNGRLDIKGLTDKQQKEIDRLIAIHEKLKNAS